MHGTIPGLIARKRTIQRRDHAHRLTRCTPTPALSQSDRRDRMRRETAAGGRRGITGRRLPRGPWIGGRGARRGREPNCRYTSTPVEARPKRGRQAGRQADWGRGTANEPNERASERPSCVCNATLGRDTEGITRSEYSLFPDVFRGYFKRFKRVIDFAYPVKRSTWIRKARV